MARRNKKGQFVKASSTRRPVRIRRVRKSRSERRMARVRSGKRRFSVLKMAGFGVGTYLGLTTGHASDPGYVVQNPEQSMINLFTAITGIGFAGGPPSWSAQNLGPFWVPVITTVGLDWIGKKLFHTNVKLTKELSLF
jgi:hypothetical protein